jgi:hypothetical protein
MEDEIVCGAERTPAHTIKENVWRDRLRRALEKNGYTVEVEKRVVNGRVDLFLPNHAIEIDWSFKWAEGVGQALYYAARLKAKAVALLLVESDAGGSHVQNALTVSSSIEDRLSVWVLDTRTEILHMGHGRTIQVE